MAKWNIWKKITETISKSKAWLDGQSNAVKVLCAGAMSVIIFVLTYFVAIKNSNSNSNSNSVGYWNFIILIVSAPVAFVIWHFRDENNRQQIENQRKDINLKEFQKLSEWVSGAHLPEIKTVSKTTQKSSSKDEAEITEQPTEQSEEYAKRRDTTDFDTFSKRDGAIALQISAIYNLLPFFRGDYGESFRLPAFNLLKSAWQAMQQDSLNRLRVEVRIEQGNEKSVEYEDIIWDEENVKYEVTKKAKSPIGVALTYVLSSLNQSGTKANLSEFPIELLENLCLVGIYLSWIDLSGLKSPGINLYGTKLVNVNLQNSVLYEADIRRSYIASANLRNAMLDSSDLTRTHLIGTDLTGAQLVGANLTEANLRNINLRNANLQNAVLIDAKLSGVNLQNADLRSTEFEWKNLSQSNNLRYAKITVNDFVYRIYHEWDKEGNMKWSSQNERLHVMQKFSEETGIQIFDDAGNIMVGE